MKNNLSKGFTLVELLVVVAILGILAVGVVTLLNPAQKTREATDTANKNVASEIVGAFDRFYLDGYGTTAGQENLSSGTHPNMNSLTTGYPGGYVKDGVTSSGLFTDAGVFASLETTADTAEVCFDTQSTKYQAEWGARPCL